MKKIICFFLSLSLAGLTSCALSDSENKNSDSEMKQKILKNIGEEPETAVAEREEATEAEKKKNFEWYIEPSVEADDIIVSDNSFDVSIIDDRGSDKYSFIERDGRYNFISYDGEIALEQWYSEPKILELGELGLGGEGDVMLQGDIFFEIFGGRGASPDVYYVYPYDRNTSEIYHPVNIGNPQHWGYNCEYSCDYGTAVLIQEADIREPSDSPYTEIDYNGKYGAAYDNKVTVQPSFDDGIMNVYNDMIALKSGGKWGYFNGRTGEQIIDFIADEIDSAYYCESQKNGIQNAYTEPRPYTYSDGYVVIHNGDGWALYDEDGQIVVDYGEFEQIRPVHNDRTWVKDNETGLWGIIQLSAPDLSSDSAISGVHYIGSNFYNLQSGGLAAENDDMVVYLTYKEASAFNVDSYNNQDLIYTGQVWKYDKNSGSASVILGGDGWDSIWSASRYDYPVENINIAEDGTIYFSRYIKDDSATCIYSLDSETGEETETAMFKGRIKNMALVDNALYIATETGVTAYYLNMNRSKTITETGESLWNAKLISFYEDSLYYSYETYNADNQYTVMLGIYNVNTQKSELISLTDLNNDTTWSNLYPCENGLLSIDYDYITEYSFTDKKAEKHPNPCKNLSDDMSGIPAAFVYFDGDYYSYTGNDSHHIIRIKNDFSSAENTADLSTTFQASDGSTFIERNFIFGIAGGGLWTAGNSIVRKYSSDGNSETLYKK